MTELLKSIQFSEVIPNADWKFRVPDDVGIAGCQAITTAVTPEESPHGKALEIAVPGDNSAIHEMTPLPCARVEFRVKRGWTPIYIRLRVTDIRRKIQPGCALVIDPVPATLARQDPEPHLTPGGQSVPNEWRIHPAIEMIGEGQWEKIAVDIGQEFAASFGLDGSTLAGVEGIALRGDMVISTVEFFA